MSNEQFMGLLIASIGTLLAIASIIVAIIVKPIISLNKSITKLNDSIDILNRDSSNLEARVTKHGKEIDEVRERTLTNEHEIKHIKEKIK